MQLPPELMQQIQDAIANGTLKLNVPGTPKPGRWRDPRQLDDLRLGPQHDDARPLFVWSAAQPRQGDTASVYEYPKLMWKGDTGFEITVRTRDEQADRQRAGFVLTAPHQVLLDPMEQLRQDWESLSGEDQAVIMKAQKEDRITALTQRLAQLDPDQLEAMMAGATKKRKAQ